MSTSIVVQSSTRFVNFENVRQISEPVRFLERAELVLRRRVLARDAHRPRSGEPGDAEARSRRS
jgi:hypothetical protein